VKITFNPLQIDADKWEKYYDTFPELFTVEEIIENEYKDNENNTEDAPRSTKRTKGKKTASK
jgi:hypothetical protein